MTIENEAFPIVEEGVEGNVASTDQELFGEVLDQIEDTTSSVQEIINHLAEILEIIGSNENSKEYVCLTNSITKVIREATNKIIMPLINCNYVDMDHITIKGENATVQELSDYIDAIDDYMVGEFKDLKDKVESAIDAAMEEIEE